MSERTLAFTAVTADQGDCEVYICDRCDTFAPVWFGCRNCALLDSLQAQIDQLKRLMGDLVIDQERKVAR